MITAKIQICFDFLVPIFQANRVATKLAALPPMMSTIPNPPKKLATIVPKVTPMMVGHPKMIASGSKASATLTWKILKLMGARTTTATAYNTANTAAKEMSLDLANFKFSPLYSGIYYAQRVGGPLTRLSKLLLV